jgi:hypothetical protein
MNPQGSGRLPVTIRAMGGRDLPGLLQMRRGGARLDLPDALVCDYTPLTGLVRGRWNPLRGARIRTYVAATNRAPLGFVQVRERATDARNKWDLLYLGAARASAVSGAGRRVDLWTALLDYVTVAAGRRGIQRLYAKVPGEGEAAEAFHSSGYTRYGEETLFLLERQPEHDEGDAEPLAIRPQAPGDTWALHRLYTLTAPKGAQFAEAYTSQHWELPRRRAIFAQGGPREAGFVVERGHEIAIYCRVARQGNRARLEFVYEAAARELLPQTLRAIVRWLDPGPGERLYCTAREFQAELARALQDCGFAAKEVQDVLVRYTVVSARTPALAAVKRSARERRLVGVPAGSLRRQAHGPQGGPPGDIVTEQTEVRKLAEI